MVLTGSPRTLGSLTVSPIPTWLALETQTAVLWWGNVLEASSTTLGMQQGLDLCEFFLLSVMGSISDLLFSHSVVSDSLRPHGLQHARFPCPPLSPGICSNSCPLSQWCHKIIQSSVTPFSCPQSFPASSFPMSQCFASSGQSIRASALASVLPMSIQSWFPLGLIGLISLLSQGLSRLFSSTTVWKHQFFGIRLLYGPSLTSVRDYWKNHSFDFMDLYWQSDVSAF